MARSKAGVLHFWLEAMFHERPNSVRMKKVRIVCVRPESTVLFTPKSKNLPMSPRVALLPRESSTKVTALRMCWNTDVPAAVVRKSMSMQSARLVAYTRCCHSAPVSHAAGTSGTNSWPTLDCWVSTPAARRPTRAGTNTAKELSVICAKVTPHPRSSTMASTNTKPPSMRAMEAPVTLSSYDLPPYCMYAWTAKGARQAKAP
mmetsp:Transcript_17346/g.58162  ORF Transcript_17346/g.58162 Transcript_17346/m.58162 type:complete len:203 (-) Transcript_17346:525-1133(-)